MKGCGRKLSEIGDVIIPVASATVTDLKMLKSRGRIPGLRDEVAHGKSRIRSRDVTVTFDSFSSCFCLPVKSKYFCNRPVPKRYPSRPVEGHVPNHINLYYYELQCLYFKNTD